MATELIVNASLPETRIVLMENGEIQELLIERASGKGIVGNIYKGRVTRVLPGMQAAFVDIGLEKAAFLYVDDVFVHSEIWEKEEGSTSSSASSESEAGEGEASEEYSEGQSDGNPLEAENSTFEDEEFADAPEVQEENEEEGDDDSGNPVAMSAEGDGGEGSKPHGTVAPGESVSETGSAASPAQAEGVDGGRRRRGRRGGRNRRRDRGGQGSQLSGGASGHDDEGVADTGTHSAEGAVTSEEGAEGVTAEGGEVEGSHHHLAVGEEHEALSGRPGSEDFAPAPAGGRRVTETAEGSRPEFKEQRNKDRKIRSKERSRQSRPPVSIQDLLKEGQEVIVQVAKDPIATKGARLTCHISLPGRHLVCMPTIDHIGVSRRIERDDERRKLREFVEKNRPRNLGFIVRTATGGKNTAEKRLKQDMEYLNRLWEEIREKAATVTAPALVYEDLNSVLRAIRDWVTEDIDRIVVDSRYYYNDIQRFVSHFMPALRSRVEVYEKSEPVFDAFGLTPELARAMDRKVWLKSGGYLVIDQAEALVAIDVNTGRFVGKKNLEDTILKTNLEAVAEIAYQLRLRNCGGIIILDLIDMEKEENKQRVYKALEEALKKDRARPVIQKISDLGLIEMTRKRTRDTMVRTMCESCSHCEGKGYVKSKQTIGFDILREIEREGFDRDVSKVLVQAHPEVIDLLALDERETIDGLERRFRKQVYLQAVHEFHQEQFEVVGERRAGTSSEKRVTTDERPARNREREQSGNREREAGGNRERGGRDRDRGRGGRDRDRNRQQGGQPGQAQVQAQRQNHSRPQPRPLEGAAVSDVAIPAPAELGGHSTAGVDSELAAVRAQAAQAVAQAQPGHGPQAGPRSEGGRDAGGDAGGDRRGRRRRGRRGGRRRFEGRDRAGAGAGGAGDSEGGSSDSSGQGSGGGESGGAVPPTSAAPVTPAH